MSSKLDQLSVYLPPQQGRLIKARALSRNGSVSKYLKALIERDIGVESPSETDHTALILRHLEQLVEFSRYSTVIQNATADRLSPGLLDEVQDLYRDKFGSADNAR